MWFSRNKTVKELGLLEDMTDIHSHLLWGVDDGSKSAEATTEMISAIKEVGIRRMFCTPHIMANLIDNNSEYLECHFSDKIKSPYIDCGIEFRLAAEYMLDESFLSRFSNEKLLTYDDYHILIEVSYLSKPLNFDDMIFEIMSSGYIPTLAHPERYFIFMSYEDLLELKERGLKFQLNIISLSGVYGKEVKMVAERLLLDGLYDFIGTDIHSLKMMKIIEGIKISKKIKKSIQKLINNNNLLWK